MGGKTLWSEYCAFLCIAIIIDSWVIHERFGLIPTRFHGQTERFPSWGKILSLLTSELALSTYF